MTDFDSEIKIPFRVTNHVVCPACGEELRAKAVVYHPGSVDDLDVIECPSCGAALEVTLEKWAKAEVTPINPTKASEPKP